MRAWFALALALVSSSSAARAEDRGEHYLGTGNHIGVELTFGLLTGDEDEIDVLGLQPLVSGRFAATKQLGIEAALPFTFVSISGGDESETDLRLGNPYLGVDWRLYGRPHQSVSLKLGVALPVAQLDEDSTDGLKALFNYFTAWGARGFHQLWLWFPENFAIVPQLRWAGYGGKLYTEAALALAFFIETSHQNDELDFIVDFKGRVGYIAGTVIPYLGLTGVLFLTSGGDIDDDEDRFQGGVELGAMFEVSAKTTIDAALHVNLDKPFDSFDDDFGFIGIMVGATFEL